MNLYDLLKKISDLGERNRIIAEHITDDLVSKVIGDGAAKVDIVSVQLTQFSMPVIAGRIYCIEKHPAEHLEIIAAGFYEKGLQVLVLGLFENGDWGYALMEELLPADPGSDLCAYKPR